MASRHFRNKARRAFWLSHVEAWRASGVGQKAYCRDHDLATNTLRRWLTMFETEAGYKLEKLEKRKHNRTRRMSRDVRCKAVQAFWAMHVEAWIWSGLSATAYADAHRIGRRSLAAWRDRLETDFADVDWRTLVHPSARPLVKDEAEAAEISTGAKTDANASGDDSGLTGGPPRKLRRSFTDEEKCAVVAEAEAPDVSVAAVARRHGIATSMIFRWRAQLGAEPDKAAALASVRLAGKRRGEGQTRDGEADVFDLIPVPEGLVRIDLDDGRRVLAPVGSDPETVRRTVAAQEQRP